MKLRELQKNFRGLKNRERIDTQVVRDAWEKWRDAHRHPRNSAENANLAQYDAAYFSQHIVRPLRKKAVESEAQFTKYQKWTGILRLFFRAILSLLTALSFYIFFCMICGIITLEYEITVFLVNVLLSSLISVVLNYNLIPLTRVGKIFNILWIFCFFLIFYLHIIEDWKIRNIDILIISIFIWVFILHTILQFIFSFLLIKNISKLLKRHELSEKNSLSGFKDILYWFREFLYEKLKRFLQVLLELRSHLIATPDYSFLRYWNGCTSAGGVPASTEAHGLSLLSAHLSTFDVFASLFFPTGNSRTGGGNNGLVPV